MVYFEVNILSYMYVRIHCKNAINIFLQQCAVSTIFRMVGNQAGSLVGWLGRKKNSRPHFEWALNPIGRGGGSLKQLAAQSTNIITVLKGNCMYLQKN